MDCREADSYVQPYIDGTLTTQECAAYLAHIRTCPQCKQELLSYYTIDYALRNLADDTGADLSYDMRSIVDEDIRHAERRIRLERLARIWMNVAVLAAEIAAVFTILWHFNETYVEQIIVPLLGL